MAAGALRVILIAGASMAGALWPMRGMNPQRMSQSVSGSTPDAWTFGAQNVIPSSPAIGDNGAVFVGSDDYNIYSLNGPTGGLIWSFSTGGEVRSSPALSAGVLFVGSLDFSFYALDSSSGALMWRFTTGAGIVSSPAVDNGTVFFGSLDNSVFALSVSTGALCWRFATGAGVSSSPAVSDGVLYVASYDSRMYALNATTGVVRWSYPTGDYVYSSPAIAGGAVFFGGADSVIRALDASTGALRWQFDTGSAVLGSPAVAGGTVYIGNSRGIVYALLCTGGLRWNYAVGANIMNGPAISPDGTVFVSAGTATVALSGSTGNVRWAGSTTGAVVWSSPALAADGTVYVGAWDNLVYALKPSLSASPRPSARRSSSPLPTTATSSSMTQSPSALPGTPPDAPPIPGAGVGSLELGLAIGIPLVLFAACATGALGASMYAGVPVSALCTRAASLVPRFTAGCGGGGSVGLNARGLLVPTPMSEVSAARAHALGLASTHNTQVWAPIVPEARYVAVGAAGYEGTDHAFPSATLGAPLTREA